MYSEPWTTLSQDPGVHYFTMKIMEFWSHRGAERFLSGPRDASAPPLVTHISPLSLALARAREREAAAHAPEEPSEYTRMRAGT